MGMAGTLAAQDLGPDRSDRDMTIYCVVCRLESPLGRR